MLQNRENFVPMAEMPEDELVILESDFKGKIRSQKKLEALMGSLASGNFPDTSELVKKIPGLTSLDRLRAKEFAARRRLELLNQSAEDPSKSLVQGIIYDAYSHIVEACQAQIADIKQREALAE